MLGAHQRLGGGGNRGGTGVGPGEAEQVKSSVLRVDRAGGFEPGGGAGESLVSVCLLGRRAVGLEGVDGQGGGLIVAGVHRGPAAFDRSPMALGGLHSLHGTDGGIGIFVAGNAVVPEVEHLPTKAGDTDDDQVHDAFRVDGVHALRKLGDLLWGGKTALAGDGGRGGR